MLLNLKPLGLREDICWKLQMANDKNNVTISKLKRLFEKLGICTVRVTDFARGVAVALFVAILQRVWHLWTRNKFQHWKTFLHENMNECWAILETFWKIEFCRFSKNKQLKNGFSHFRQKSLCPPSRCPAESQITSKHSFDILDIFDAVDLSVLATFECEQRDNNQSCQTRKTGRAVSTNYTNVLKCKCLQFEFRCFRFEFLKGERTIFGAHVFAPPKLRSDPFSVLWCWNELFQVF